ncbi:RNA-directed DNA polymerase, eukaryota, reverse transcriptase zinc-binding domain protein [Tanacetum coccineum]|uniref:RNA-directed DNA polymerase, eukaryota, reverse transcriptase zinc-binding domain protein n=1 Tax=Tanacetum coccineum TaxID=301880 RepID=A0ABQ5F742_9ASTR
MGGIHYALSKEVSSGLIRGIKLGSSDITLSHLFYADDVVITTDWNSRDIDNIIRVLYVFYLASGLRINIHKSNIYGIEVSNDEISSLASRTGCASVFFPFTYLGLPIGANMNLTSRGRLTLIKAVLGSLGIYYLSIFKALESILNTLESLRSRFFWGGSQDSKNMAWVKWSHVLPSFDKGGLNISSLKAFNLALLQKIVGTYYLLHSKDIIPLNSFRFKVGCGTRIRFWKDIWIGDSPLLTRYNRLYRLDKDKDCLIIDRIVDGHWNWNWSRDDIEKPLIDSKLLPSILSSTSWDNILPRKVNIFLWRLYLDRLPHRLNLSSRGIDIPTISCSSCNGNVESAYHIFFACDLAKDVLSLVRKWCDLSSPSFASYIWRYRNSIIFCPQPMKKGDLFDNICASSFSWLSHRGQMSSNWIEWLKNPLLLAGS